MGKSVTESNQSLRRPAQRAADMNGPWLDTCHSGDHLDQGDLRASGYWRSTASFDEGSAICTSFSPMADLAMLRSMGIVGSYIGLVVNQEGRLAGITGVTTLPLPADQLS